LALGKRRHDGATGFAGLGAHIEEVISLAHHRFIMLDDDEGVPFIAEIVHHFGEAGDVTGMESHGGFIEDEKSLRESGAETGGEIDPGDFASGEGPGGAI